MKTLSLAILFSLSVLAQDVVVTLGDVLLFTYPGVEWSLIEPPPPETPSITLWDSDDPQPTIEALEALRDDPSDELLEAVKTGVFPEPPN